MSGLGDQHDHGQVIEELERADHALARLVTVRPGRLPQGAAHPGPPLPAGSYTGTGRWRTRCPGRVRSLARLILHPVRLLA